MSGTRGTCATKPALLSTFLVPDEMAHGPVMVVLADLDRRMSQSVAAAERARLRERQRMVDSGLSDRFFETSGGGGRAGGPGAARSASTGRDAMAEGTDALEAPAAKRGAEGTGEVDYADEDEMLRLQREDRSAVKIEPFNLKAERESGTFDADGNYQWRRRDRAGEDGEPSGDAWLDSLEESQNKGTSAGDALLAPKSTNYKRKRAAAGADADGLERSYEAHVQALVDLLEDGETVLKALSRFGKKQGKGYDKAKMDAVTDNAHAIVEQFPEVYESTRRTLEGEVREERTKLMDKVKWQYRTSMDAGAELHGPFDASTLEGWRKQGFFSAPGTTVFFRRCPAAAAAASAPQRESAKMEDDDEEASGASKSKKRKVATAADLLADFDDDDEDDDDGDEKEGSKTAMEPRTEPGTEPGTGEWKEVALVNFCDVFT